VRALDQKVASADAATPAARGYAEAGPGVRSFVSSASPPADGAPPVRARGYTPDL
jgi:hypothetical protein